MFYIGLFFQEKRKEKKGKKRKASFEPGEKVKNQEKRRKKKGEREKMEEKKTRGGLKKRLKDKFHALLSDSIQSENNEESELLQKAGKVTSPPLNNGDLNFWSSRFLEHGGFIHDGISLDLVRANAPSFLQAARRLKTAGAGQNKIWTSINKKIQGLDPLLEMQLVSRMADSIRTHLEQLNELCASVGQLIRFASGPIGDLWLALLNHMIKEQTRVWSLLSSDKRMSVAEEMKGWGTERAEHTLLLAHVIDPSDPSQIETGNMGWMVGNLIDQSLKEDKWPTEAFKTSSQMAKATLVQMFNHQITVQLKPEMLFHEILESEWETGRLKVLKKHVTKSLFAKGGNVNRQQLQQQQHEKKKRRLQSDSHLESPSSKSTSQEDTPPAESQMLQSPTTSESSQTGESPTAEPQGAPTGTQTETPTESPGLSAMTSQSTYNSMDDSPNDFHSFMRSF